MVTKIMGAAKSSRKLHEPTKQEADTDGDPPLRSENDVETDQRQIKVLILGAGQRGQIYATYASDFPYRMKVVGVAEPITYRREMIKNSYKIDEHYVFEDWKDVGELLTC